MASAKAKIRHLFGDTFSCRAAPPDILVKLSGRNIDALKHRNEAVLPLYIFEISITQTFLRFS